MDHNERSGDDGRGRVAGGTVWRNWDLHCHITVSYDYKLGHPVSGNDPRKPS
jgi:hypothetical protein